MSSKKCYAKDALKPATILTKRTVRKNLTAEALFALVYREFKKVNDTRATNKKIPIEDAMMAALAVFLLKDPSLLAFDQRRLEEPENLRSVFGIGEIACDSQMRTILDPQELHSLRSPFCAVFREIQRGKDLEKMSFLDGHYLLSGDGTGYYSSEKVTSPYCLMKKKKNGKIMYYQQMYAAAIVHPDCNVVIPLFPEIITLKDGTDKQDCERKAAKRFYSGFRREHPHLKTIVIEDALSSNGPHIRQLQDLDLRYILGAKPSDHKHLFAQLTQGVEDGTAIKVEHLDKHDRNKAHFFTFKNGVSLNKENPDLLVNVLEYTQIDKNEKMTTFSWVTDIEITKENVFDLMRAGRARWKIENETFNTLKNQGYNLGHNYGLGKKNLSAIFSILMMLAFLIDQTQQLSCWLFQEALQKSKRKKYLWEKIRNYYGGYRVDSMETILRVIAFGFEKPDLKHEPQT